jgi:hypothetical protein
MHDQPDMRGLEAIAYAQHGYFTTTQARERGFSSQLLSHYLRRNRFERVRRGLYRLPGFPRSEDDEMREKWMAVGARPFLGSASLGSAELEITVDPARVGSNQVHLYLFDARSGKQFSPIRNWT